MLPWKYCDCSIRILDCSIRVHRSLAYWAVNKLIDQWLTALVWYHMAQNKYIHIDGSSEARFNHATHRYKPDQLEPILSISCNLSGSHPNTFFMEDTHLTRQKSDLNNLNCPGHPIPLQHCLIWMMCLNRIFGTSVKQLTQFCVLPITHAHLIP